jgi:hypothetical protein
MTLGELGATMQDLSARLRAESPLGAFKDLSEGFFAAAPQSSKGFATKAHQIQLD